MDWRELLGELERHTRLGSWDDLPPFRETFLAQLTDRQQRAGLRDFGRLLAWLATEAPAPTSTPAAGWRAGLCAGLADLRFTANHLAVLSRDFLTTEPEGSPRHRRACAAGLLALKLARAAQDLEGLSPRRRRNAREPVPDTPGSPPPAPGSPEA